MNVILNGVEYVATPYAFPKRGNAPEGFGFLVNGVAAEVAKTGGGKYPEYAYFKYDGKSYYLPKGIVPKKDEDVQVVVVVKPEVAEAAPAADEVLKDEVSDGSDAMNAPKGKRSRSPKKEAA